ncbi:MAG: RidA family protein [Gammaproteobacteria bacterium]|nr:RidA family protein [Gammaproteobacteria bacterium]
MSKTIIETPNAPAAIGPYSQAVRINDVLYLSGQIPLDPETMEIVAGDFHSQARQVFTNLSAVLSAAGADFTQVAKLTIYLTDLARFATVNTVMAEFFAEPYPARAAIGVAQLPRGAEIEIEGLAVFPSDS